MRSVSIATALMLAALSITSPEAYAQAAAAMTAGSTWLIDVIRAGGLILVSIGGLALFNGRLTPVMAITGLAGLAIAIYPNEVMAFIA